MCGVYMEVRNISPEIRSKICNIFLVAIANTQDFKTRDASFDTIAQKMVKELKILESVGLEVAPGEVLKCALINIQPTT